MHIIDSSGRRLNIVSLHSTHRVTRRQRLSLMRITPGNGPPIYHVVGCKGCHCRRRGHRGRTGGGRGILALGRMGLHPGVRSRSFCIGVGTTRHFLNRNDGIGIAVVFHNHRVDRPRLNHSLLIQFTSRLGSATRMRGRPGVRNEGVAVIVTIGGGWRRSGCCTRVRGSPYYNGALWRG